MESLASESLLRSEALDLDPESEEAITEMDRKDFISCAEEELDDEVSVELLDMDGGGKVLPAK